MAHIPSRNKRITSTKASEGIIQRGPSLKEDFNNRPSDKTRRSKSTVAEQLVWVESQIVGIFLEKTG